MRDATRASSRDHGCGHTVPQYLTTGRKLTAIILSAVFALIAALAQTASAAADFSSEPRVTLPGHMLGALSQATLLPMKDGEIENLDAPITLTVVLNRSDQPAFQEYLRDVYNPESPRYRQFLRPTEVSDRFGPGPDNYAALQAYFEQQGFTVVEPSANRLTLTVRGTRAQAENALNVRIVDYRVREKSFYANDREPSLPASLAPRVQGIAGLSNLARPHGATLDQFERACSLLAIGAAGAALLIESLATGPFAIVALFGAVLCFLIDETAKANPPPKAKPAKKAHKTHNQSKKRKKKKSALAEAALTAKDGSSDAPDGTGQKIGLLEFDSFQSSDVSNYLALVGASPARINQLSTVAVNGGTAPGVDTSEVLLDIAMVMRGAPGASYVVYDAPANTSYQALFNAMINGGVTIISNSWSSCEDEVSLAEAQTVDAVLQTAAASGISVFNGAGDSGTTCLDGSPNTVGLPADSPNATAVGGTSITFARGFMYGSETWWNGGAATPPSGEGGLGVSKYFPRPSYQNGLNPSAMRSVPDVSVNADPSSGAHLCVGTDGGCPNGKLYGGTSMAAPIWAAYAALINDSQGANLGNFNLALYPLAHTDAFHSAASMGSDFAHVGLGSPNLGLIDQALAGQITGAVDATESEVFAASTILNGHESPAVLDGIPADGVSAGTVVVRLYDANGNIVIGKTVTLAANAGSTAVITPSSGVTSVSNGAVVFTVTDLTPEVVNFTATDTTDNVVLQDSDSLTFGVPFAASASIVASPNAVPADGSSQTTITVTLKDALNRPTPGKAITLSQGNGHSIITGPTPAVTDANGQIAFTGTDIVGETVTYTAVDVTDGELPVPGSAGVTFTGAGSSCVGTPPTAAPGFTLTPFANGFMSANLFYSNVNWGCQGAYPPAFYPDGTVLVTDFIDGNLYRLGSSGGAISNANLLSNIGVTVERPAFGKDGSLYIARGATGSGFNSGVIERLDPTTGAVLNVLASGLTCPSAVIVDPISGDLFFGDTCFGAGSDNPSIWRISNPSSANPTMSVYATLPSTPMVGAPSFAPNGTLYAGYGQPLATGKIARIAGTNTASPGSLTTLSGITAADGVSVVEAQANGDAKSLLVVNGNNLTLIDITTNPFTATVLATGSNIAPGTIGPDGCLYNITPDTVFKLSPATGPCTFLPTSPSPTLVLSPATVTPNPAQGTSQTLTATFKNVSVPAGTPVFFEISGSNALAKLAPTDANGVASISYTGVLAGSDRIIATSTVGASDYISNQARITWGSGVHVASLTLNLSPSGGAPGNAVTLVGSLTDVSVDPQAPISGATVTFSIGSQSCNGVTDAQGNASCTLIVPTGVPLTLTGTFAGNAQAAAATASELFQAVSAAPGPPKSSGPAPIPTLDKRILVLLSVLVLLLGIAMARRSAHRGDR